MGFEHRLAARERPDRGPDATADQGTRKVAHLHQVVFHMEDRTVPIHSDARLVCWISDDARAREV